MTTPILAALLGVITGALVAVPLVVALWREVARLHAILDAAARDALQRSERLGDLLDRVRAEAVPAEPLPDTPAPPPLPPVVEAAIEGFVDGDVQEHMRDRAYELMRLMPDRDPETIVEDLLRG